MPPRSKSPPPVMDKELEMMRKRLREMKRPNPLNEGSDDAQCEPAIQDTVSPSKRSRIAEDKEEEAPPNEHGTVYDLSQNTQCQTEEVQNDFHPSQISDVGFSQSTQFEEFMQSGGAQEAEQQKLDDFKYQKFEQRMKGTDESQDSDDEEVDDLMRKKPKESQSGSFLLGTTQSHSTGENGVEQEESIADEDVEEVEEKSVKRSKKGKIKPKKKNKKKNKSKDKGKKKNKKKNKESNDGDSDKETYLDENGKVVVTAHGVTWKEITTDPIDIRENCMHRKASLLWGSNQRNDRSILEYFCHFFLTHRYITQMIELMNLRLKEKKQKALNGENEFYVFIGLLLTHRVFCNLSREEIFRPVYQDVPAAPIQDEAFLINPNMSRYMSLHRFKAILGSVCFAHEDGDDVLDSDVELEEDDDEGDDSLSYDTSWKSAQPLIDAFNNGRLAGFDPSWKLCCDESMSPWKGKDQRHADGSKHVTKMKRKPKGVGTEIKNIADVETGILCRLELVGNKNQPPQEFDNAYGKNCAVLLRLCKPYKGTGRTVVADSGFSSYTSAVQMKVKMNLFLFGMVKTAHKFFPRNYLLNKHEYTNPGQGTSLTLETTSEEGITVYAVGWNDKKTKTIVTTAGTSVEGEPHKKREWKQVVKNGRKMSQQFYKEVPRTAQVAEYFDGAQMIDVHNHRRQGNLALEIHVKTHNWRVRLFSTILGMCFVDAFLAYKHFQDSTVTQGMFLRSLVTQLLNNNFSKANQDPEVAGQVGVGAAPGQNPGALGGVNHTFESVGQHPAFASAKKKHKRCSVSSCGKVRLVFLSRVFGVW